MKLFFRPRSSVKPTEEDEPFGVEPWQEVREGDLTVVITFEGIDLQEQDALEVADFGRGVKGPADDFVGSATAIVGAVLGVALAFVSAIVINIAADIERNAPILVLKVPLVAFLCLLGVFLPKLVVELARALRPRPSTKHAFRLSLSPTEVILERQGFRLTLETGQIDHFEGDERMRVLQRDGAVVVLPCGVLRGWRSGWHAPLARRLNELLREYHGYRV